MNDTCVASDPSSEQASARLGLMRFGEAFRSHAAAHAWSLAAVAASLGMFSAAGTAAVAPLVHWLIRSPRASPLVDWHLLLVLPLFARPLLTVAHATAVTRLVGAVAADIPIKPRLLSSIIIITRDLPMVALLLIAMAWGNGGVGALIGLCLLAGLPLALAVDHRAQYPISSLAARRIARARREAAADLPLIFLVLALVVAKVMGHLPDVAGSANIALCGLLMRAPLRRLARLIETGR